MGEITKLIKTKITALILKEDGRISKEAILKAGIVAASMALSIGSVKGEDAADQEIAETEPTDLRLTDDSRDDVDCPTPVNANIGVGHTNSEHSSSSSIESEQGIAVVGSHASCVETHTNHASY